MSRDNIEIVRKVYEAWACDKFSESPELMDPEVEYVDPDGVVRYEWLQKPGEAFEAAGLNG
jgi:hypothetical protein